MMISVEILLINVLRLVSVVKTEIVQHKFTIKNNQDVNMAIGESNLILSVNKMFYLFCLLSCNSNQNCLTAVYDNSPGIIRNCFIYNRYFNTTEFILSSTSIVYEKKSNIPTISSKFLKTSLWNVFTNSKIQSNITQLNGNSFNWLYGFGFYLSSNSSYYLMDSGASLVYVLNDNWKLVSNKTFAYPAYMITIGTSLYMTGGSTVWKLDENLNVVIPYKATGNSPSYRGLCYNPNNSLIYVAPNNLSVIHIFDLNLTFLHNISTTPYQPFSITGYNNQLYVGTTNGTVLVIQNEIIVNQFNGCGGNNVWLTSVVFDDYGYMATSCRDPSNTLYLLYVNGTSTGKTIATRVFPYYIGFDSKGDFIQISAHQITIYS